jgi:hypothetical protein
VSATRTETTRRAAAPRPRPEPVPEPDGTVTAVTAVAGICASVAGTLLILTMPGHWPALAGALLIACVPPGAAVMCWIDAGLGVVQAGLTLVLSLTVTAITTAAMIWLTAWHPGVLLAVVFLSTVSCVTRLWRGGISPSWSTLETGGRLLGRVAPLPAGLAAWAYGLREIQPGSIGAYGLLTSANIWFGLALLLVLGGGVAELLRGAPRAWLICAYLVALIAVVYAVIPLLFGGVPEYAWVYKHVGVIQTLGYYGRVTDPSNIYQQWPALFTTVAAVSGLAKVGPLAFAAWGPLAFELADALLLLGIFRMLAGTRRSAYFALFLYEGLIAWVGQDYLSPQAFAYLLWLGIAAIIVRWLLVPGRYQRGGVVTRLRERLLARMPAPDPATGPERRVAAALVIVIYFAIVAAHQLTPYMILAGVGGLVLIGVLWRGWPLLAGLTVVAGGYLVPRYGLISSQFGGLFSGNLLQNASGVQYIARFGANEFTGRLVDVLAGSMWLLSLAAIVRRWRALGRVAVPAVLAFTPFVILPLQSYGGEAIYRVFMFSAPWCAVLIADFVMELRAIVWRRALTAVACTVAFGLGLQGLYGPVAVDAFTPQELSASLWLLNHAPSGSVIYTAADNFPLDYAVDSSMLNMQGFPLKLESGKMWTGAALVRFSENWLTYKSEKTAYVVFSRSMDAYVRYFGTPAPSGYFQLEDLAARTPGWSVAYRNADTTIYQVQVAPYA